MPGDPGVLDLSALFRLSQRPAASASMRTWVERHPATAFVVLAYAVTWALWLPLLAQTQGWLHSGPWPVLHLLGSLGPALAAVVVTATTLGRAGLADLGRRLVAWRGRGQAWAFALGLPPLLLLVAAGISALVEGRSPADLDWAAVGRSAEFTALPLGAFLVLNLVCFGFGEEIGWRGLLQPHLERRHPPVVAATLVAVVWATWHLPLFGITPSYRAMPAIGFVGFAASIWVASFVFAWLWHVGRGSVLILAVFHSWFDVATTSPLGPEVLPTAMGVLVTLVGLVVLRLLLRMPRTLPGTAIGPAQGTSGADRGSRGGSGI